MRSRFQSIFIIVLLAGMLPWEGITNLWSVSEESHLAYQLDIESDSQKENKKGFEDDENKHLVYFKGLPDPCQDNHLDVFLHHNLFSLAYRTKETPPPDFI